MRARWEMRKQIDHIHENSFETVGMLKRLVELMERQNHLTDQLAMAVNRVFDTRWNSRQ
jgi:hypothetical protein